MTHILSQGQISSFQKHIFNWWATHKRDLPWRHTHDPYKILVSELMLQQTQVARVLPKYKEFLTQFPDVYSLSKASVGEVLIAWKGMGYNRRALYLKKLAEDVVQTYNGNFPEDEVLLLQLPGLGKYTARAVQVFAFQKDVAMVDTNIRQIIVHHFFNDQPQPETLIQSVADQLVPVGKSWDWHQALMDYGSLVITKKKELKKKRNSPVILSETLNVKDLRYVREKIPSSIPQSKLPFKQTNRFFRGRIIDFLRKHSMKEGDLIQEMIEHHGRDEVFLRQILEGLLSDGLIERSKTGIISLPV